MNSNIAIPGAIGRSISRRAHLVSELHQKLNEQEERDHVLKKELLQAAPESLRELLNEEMIMNCLFEYGRWSGKVDFRQYGFNESVDVFKKIRTLEKAWEGAVKIERSPVGELRFELNFTAII